jgi:hypothetical protein
MKKSLLFVLFCLLVTTFFAQTGLFDLSYGQDLGEAHKALLAKGFKEVERTDSVVKYTNAKIPELKVLEVRDSNDDGTISGWTARYNVEGNKALVDKLKAQLDTLHDTESYYDDYFEEWVWELANDNAIYFSLTDDDKTLIIQYTVYDDYYDWW